MSSVADFNTANKPSWCPGCGDFGILNALKKSLFEGGYKREKTVLVSGIGCGSLLPYWLKTFGVCTLHGRGIPFATGVNLAHHDLNIIVNVGDGDGLGIGMGHFAHFFRRNLNMMVICDNNGVYGLTKGQTAPTAKKGTKTNSTPFGSIEVVANGGAIALQMGATFVARAYAADAPGLTKIMKMAMAHKGSSFIDILQPCVTFNKVETYAFYNSKIKKNNPEQPICATRAEAISFVNALHEDIPTGVIFREEQPTYESHLPQLKTGPLFGRRISKTGVKKFMHERI